MLPEDVDCCLEMDVETKASTEIPRPTVPTSSSSSHSSHSSFPSPLLKAFSSSLFSLLPFHYFFSLTSFFSITPTDYHLDRLRDHARSLIRLWRHSHGPIVPCDLPPLPHPHALSHALSHHRSSVLVDVYLLAGSFIPADSNPSSLPPPAPSADPSPPRATPARGDGCAVCFICPSPRAPSTWSTPTSTPRRSPAPCAPLPWASSSPSIIRSTSAPSPRWPAPSMPYTRATPSGCRTCCVRMAAST